MTISLNNQADILYWTGHGSRAGKLSYWDGSVNIPYTEGFVGHSQVGSLILKWNPTDGYYSSTNWDSDLKWAILASCNQFTWESTRLAWARTLLGRSHRAHMVLGYAEGSPVGPKDTEIVSLWGIHQWKNASIKRLDTGQHSKRRATNRRNISL